MGFNLAVIGLGKMGVLHSAILSSLPQTKIVAVYEADRFLATAGELFLPKSITLYKDLEKMITKEQLDAVFVASPIHTHVEMVTRALESNHHLNLFVEKPLANSYEQAKVAVRAVRRSKCVHMVGFQKRFSPIFQKAKAIIESGDLGHLLFFRAHSFSSDVLREGTTWRFKKGKGGALLDLGPHVLDLLSWYFGDPKPLAAVRTRFYSHEVDDYTHALLSFGSGLKGYLDVCWSIRNFRMPETLVEVHGERGTLTVTDDFATVQINDAEQKTWYKQSFETEISFLLADPEFTIEDQTFLDAIGKNVPAEPDFYEAARINALIDAINATSLETTK